MSMIEIVKNIAAIIGCILSTITLISACTKGGRAALKAIFMHSGGKEIIENDTKQTEEITAIKNSLVEIESSLVILTEHSKQQCRNTLKNIYYKYCQDKKIPLYERRTADKVYDIYCNKFKGNSYAKLLYTEISSWEILPPAPGMIVCDE